MRLASIYVKVWIKHRQAQEDGEEKVPVYMIQAYSLCYEVEPK